MHARHCSPVTGRFLSVDKGQSAKLGKPQSWNRYSYSRNNPINRIDPDGQVDQNYTPLVFPNDIEAQIEFDMKVAKGTLAVASLAVPGPEDVALAGMFAAIRLARPAAGTARGIGFSARIGKEFESSILKALGIGSAGPKLRIPSLTGTARFRVPDALTDRSLIEIKGGVHRG
jgi:hypothetical protein